MGKGQIDYKAFTYFKKVIYEKSVWLFRGNVRECRSLSTKRFTFYS